MPTNSPPSQNSLLGDVRFTGAVYTPQQVAAAIVERVSDLLPQAKLQILEPSVGDGAFLREMRSRWAGDDYTLVDIDAAVIAELQRLDRSSKVRRTEMRAADFLEYSLALLQPGGKKFDLIIGNPPFIRSRNFSPAARASVAAVAARIGYPANELKNSWAAFLAVSSHLVADKGVLAFVLPYEILTVAYGQAALKHLASIFERVDIYVSSAKAFMEIDQDAIVVIAQKTAQVRAGLFMNKVDSLDALTTTAGRALDLSSESDTALELNAYLLDPETLALLKALRKQCGRLNDCAGSAPGIVSAANEFFILKQADIDRLGFAEISEPILKKGSYSSSKPVFTADDFEAISARDPSRILRIRGERGTLPENVLAYVEAGEKAGYAARYKCRNRTHWYEVPWVAKEELFFFKRAHSYPRLCLNEAQVYLTDTAYGLRLKEGFSARGLCFSFYNTLTLLFAETDGRFYGGGVLELSPTEFRGLPIVYHEPSDNEFENFLAAHEGAAGDPTPILDFGDRWLAPKLGLSTGQMTRLRAAWTTLRMHRLRHSGRPAASQQAQSSALDVLAEPTRSPLYA